MTRLSILSKSEQREFDLPQHLSKTERGLYFHIDNNVRRSISRMKTHTRIGFVLQLGYFRANARFYPAEQFRGRDTQYVCRALGHAIFDIRELGSTIALLKTFIRFGLKAYGVS